jgi:hypothetical protein
VINPFACGVTVTLTLNAVVLPPQLELSLDSAELLARTLDFVAVANDETGDPDEPGYSTSIQKIIVVGY